MKSKGQKQERRDYDREGLTETQIVSIGGGVLICFFFALLVGITVGFTIVNRSNLPDRGHEAIMRVVSCFAKLVPVNDAAYQLHELSRLKLTFSESAESGVIDELLGRKDSPPERFEILFGELVSVVRYESAGTLSKLPQWSKWVLRVKLFLREHTRVESLSELFDRQRRGATIILNDYLKGASNKICRVLLVASFDKANGLSNFHGFDTNPRANRSCKGFMSRIGGLLRGDSFSFGLVGQIFRSISLIFHPVSKILHPVGLLPSSIRLFPCGDCLLSSGNGQIVRVLPTSVHLAPLERNKDACGKNHNEASSSPSQRGPLEAAHFLFNLFEIGCGCWLGWDAAFWIGFPDWRRTCRGLASISGAIVLVCHGGISVAQKYLDKLYSCSTVIGMANVLPLDKQIAVIGALAEGSSIRSIERLTGIHRDTITRLGVRIGKNCQLLLDSKMQDLGCNYLQFDEVWGFIGKKERHVSIDDDPEMGDVWTYCAIDSETKLVPAFKCGKRTLETTTEFVQDVASRMRHRVQVSSDAMHSYIEAMERAFGADVDYGQCVKVYAHDAAQHPERKYSAPHFASAYRRSVVGMPEMEFVSTSHVERLNATTRLHVKRLSRLTLAFSKKLDNFKAAVALHFAYYNLVRRHATLRCTPAMAAGIEKDFWTVGQLVEATS